MPKLDLSTGVSLYYEVTGSGEPLLLIMGTGGDHSFWAQQLQAYEDGFQVITYDNRGTGQADSPPDPESYSMRVLAEDAATLLDEIGIERAHVSGLSLGSTVAQELAINYPEKVRSLQLHCTWGRTDEWQRRLFQGMAYPVHHDDMEAFVSVSFMWVASPKFLNEHQDEVVEIERAYLKENPNPPTKAGLLGHLHADMTHDALDRLHRIQAPTLITSGEMDWQVPTRYGREVQERIPGSRLHVFSGPYSSHLAFVEMADEFNAVSRAFLDEQVAPEAT